MSARLLGYSRYRMRYRILEALEAQNPPLGLQDIAERLGLSYQAVRRAFRGETHSERILQAFRDAGVPEKYLFDPRRRGIRMRGHGSAPQKHTSTPAKV